MRKLLLPLMALFLVLALSACGGTSASGSSADPDTSSQEGQSPQPEPYTISDPTVEPEGGSVDGVTYVPYDGIVEHLFFHPVVAYPELAFDGDAEANGIDDYMVTADEYKKILQSVYDRGYILVDIADVWSETTDENGNAKMVRNTLYLPEGKKPLILSFDDTNYYEYMLTNGFAWKLIIGDDGKIASYGKDPQGNDVVSRDLDAIPILDKFVEEHPDFSPFGAKGCLSLTGYEGILGYRTQTDTKSWTEEQEANRQKEREAVKPIIAELKRTGWTFGSHTWGHIRSGGSKSLETIQADTQRWVDEVGSLVGPTNVLFYPHGERPDGDDWHQPVPSSAISRARASASSAPWASTASAISRRTSPPSSATGSTPTAPLFEAPTRCLAGTANSMTPGTSSTWTCGPSGRSAGRPKVPPTDAF